LHTIFAKWPENKVLAPEKSFGSARPILKTETDPTKRAMEARLLAEEKLKQKPLPTYDKKD
jgi:hypothetical protein